MAVSEPATIAIPGPLIDQLVAQAMAGAPLEQCGLLIGRPGVVMRAFAARNADAAAFRYTVEPADHFEALRSARRDHLDVIGVWHSHPAGGARPSATDIAEAHADFLYVIVGLAPAPEVRAWQLVDGNFARRHLVRT